MQWSLPLSFAVHSCLLQSALCYLNAAFGWGVGILHGQRSLATFAWHACILHIPQCKVAACKGPATLGIGGQGK
eukprot:4831886-Amphidinium_carterae.1